MKMAVVSVALSALFWAVPVGAASAAQPESSGVQSDTYSFTVDCGSFDALVQGTSTFREVHYYDASGELTRWVQFIRAPRDVWTNTVTGKSIVVRGEFQQTYTPDPVTGVVTVDIRGFRYLVNEAGAGVTLQEVGRIVYAGLDEVAVVSEAGRHGLSDPAAVEGRLCDELR